jgi:hypothetical protein
MKIELLLNELEGDWWFELGISLTKTPYHPDKRMLLAIGFVIFTLYIRW